MSIAEEMDRIAEEALEDAGKEADLVNLTFMINSVELARYEYQGEKRESYIGMVVLDGQEVERFWLSGAIMRRQIDYLVKEGAFPVRVKLIRDADRKGLPYVLKVAAGRSKVEAPQTKEAVAPPRTIRTDSDDELIRAAVDAVGIDEVSLALGENADNIMVNEDGSFTLITKGMKLSVAALMRTKLRKLTEDGIPQ